MAVKHPPQPQSVEFEVEVATTPFEGTAPAPMGSASTSATSTGHPGPGPVPFTFADYINGVNMDMPLIGTGAVYEEGEDESQIYDVASMLQALVVDEGPAAPTEALDNPNGEDPDLDWAGGLNWWEPPLPINSANNGPVEIDWSWDSVAVGSMVYDFTDEETLELEWSGAESD